MNAIVPFRYSFFIRMSSIHKNPSIHYARLNRPEGEDHYGQHDQAIPRGDDHPQKRVRVLNVLIVLSAVCAVFVQIGRKSEHPIEPKGNSSVAQLPTAGRVRHTNGTQARASVVHQVVANRQVGGVLHMRLHVLKVRVERVGAVCRIRCLEWSVARLDDSPSQGCILCGGIIWCAQ